MAITIRQAGSAQSAAGVYTKTLTFTVLAGSAIHVVAGGASSGYTISCSDNVNGSYNALESLTTTSPTNFTLQQFVFLNSAAGTITITVTMSGGSGNTVGMWVRELTSSSGQISTLSGHNGQLQAAPGNGANAISSGSITPSAIPGFISAFNECIGSGGPTTSGTGFNLDDYNLQWPDIHNGWFVTSEDKTYSTTASTAGTFTDSTQGGTNTYMTFAALFQDPNVQPEMLAPVYVENIIPIRRNVQSLAATFLLLSAAQPSGTFINVPPVNVTVTPQVPSGSESNTPMLISAPQTYFEQPTTFLRNNWIARTWLLTTTTTAGPVINVPSVSVAVTPSPPFTSQNLMWLYWPSDDGWWPEPEIPKANPNRNLLLLGASTATGNVTIPMPLVSVTVTPYVPSPIVSGGGLTINMPSPVAVTVTPYAPTVTQINTITLQVPVCQVAVNPQNIQTPLGVMPTAVVTIGPLPPTVSTGGITIWDATFRCVNAGLIIGQDQWITNPTIAYGYVISQSPASGTVVPPWTTVNFIVSFGPGAVQQQLTVPSVVGLEAYQAEQACIAAGMDIIPRAYAYSTTIAPDYVIAQSVVAGTAVYFGTPISMTVSIGPSPTTTTVTVP